MTLVVVKQNGINSDVFSGQCCLISQSVTLGENTEQFTTTDGFKVMA